MSEIEDGGAAFPWIETHPTMGSRGENGMSIRDYFAGQALAGMLANPISREYAPEREAVAAYGYADAMLAERSK